MGKRLRNRHVRSHSQQPSHADTVDEELINAKDKSTGLSLKDAGVILSISSILSIILVTCTVGVTGVVDKFSQNEFTDIALACALLLIFFALLCYTLVKVAAHYIVYIGVATLIGLIFPVSPRKRRSTIKEIYEKAK